MFSDILQPTHLLFVLVVALLVLGPKRLPEVGRSLGRGLRDFKSALGGDDQDPPQEIVQPSAQAAEPIYQPQPAATAAPEPAPPEPNAAPESHPTTPTEPHPTADEPQPVREPAEHAS